MLTPRRSDSFWDSYTNDSVTIDLPVTDKLVATAELKLGFKLPQTYIDLIRTRNGGYPTRTCYPLPYPTACATDYIEIASIRGLGGSCGTDSETVRTNDAEWGYPISTGIVVCNCHSDVHAVVMLDYSLCGPNGEPRVVYVAVETDTTTIITPLADDFATFLSGLFPYPMDYDCAYEDDKGLLQLKYYSFDYSFLEAVDYNLSHNTLELVITTLISLDHPKISNQLTLEGTFSRIKVTLDNVRYLRTLASSRLKSTPTNDLGIIDHFKIKMILDIGDNLQFDLYSTVSSLTADFGDYEETIYSSSAPLLFAELASTNLAFQVGFESLTITELG